MATWPQRLVSRGTSFVPDVVPCDDCRWKGSNVILRANARLNINPRMSFASPTAAVLYRDAAGIVPLPRHCRSLVPLPRRQTRWRSRPGAVRHRLRRSRAAVVRLCGEADEGAVYEHERELRALPRLGTQALHILFPYTTPSEMDG